MHTFPASFQTLQRIFLAVGAVGLVISCLMTWKFGAAMSWLHAVALCTVTVMAAFIFPAKTFLDRAGAKTAGRVIACLGVFFVALEFFSHLGYTIGMRERSAVEATAQQVAYKHEQDILADERANLAMFRQRLADLQEQNKWTASVTADSLRYQLESAQKAVDLETARGGCKSKCLKLMQAKADLEGKIAIAEQTADLSKQIEATQRIVDKKSETAVVAKTGFSPVSAQTDFVAQLWFIASGAEAEKALNPDQVSLTLTQILIGFFIALGATFLPTTAFYLAFWGQETTEGSKAPAKPLAATAVVSGGHNTHTERIVEKPIYINDNAALRRIAELVQGSGLMDAKAAA